MKKVDQSVALPAILLLLLITQFYFVQARYVKLIDHKCKPLDIGNVVADETTVGELKQIISNRLGIELSSVCLTGDARHPFQDESRVVAEYLDINDPAIVRLCKDLSKPGIIHISTNEESFHIKVTKNKTLAWFKNEALYGIEKAKTHRVFFAGRELIDQSKTLADYKLFDGAQVSLFTDQDQFQVVVDLANGTEFLLFGTIETTIQDLYKMIENKGVDMSNKLLYHRRERLNDSRTLFSYIDIFHYGISVEVRERISDSGANLEMIYLKKDFLQHFPVFVLANNTVSDLKRYTINVERSIPIDQMILIFERKEMDNGEAKLAEFDLYPGAWIQVKRR